MARSVGVLGEETSLRLVRGFLDGEEGMGEEGEVTFFEGPEGPRSGGGGRGLRGGARLSRGFTTKLPGVTPLKRKELGVVGLVVTLSFTLPPPKEPWLEDEPAREVGALERPPREALP